MYVTGSIGGAVGSAYLQPLRLRLRRPKGFWRQVTLLEMLGQPFPNSQTAE